MKYHQDYTQQVKNKSSVPVSGLLITNQWLEVLFIAFLVVLISGIFAGNGGVIAFGIMGITAGLLSYLFSRVALNQVFYQKKFNGNRFFVDELVEMQVEITNKKPIPVPWIRMQDEMSESFEVVNQDVTNFIFNSYTKTQILRHFASMRWYERIRWKYELKCTRRGVFKIGPSKIESTEPFGMFGSQINEDSFDEIIVYPKIVPLDELILPPLKPFGESSGGMELIQDFSGPRGLREYSSGDKLSTINWKSSAKLQKLHVNLYDPSSSHTIIVAVAVDSLETYWAPGDTEIIENIMSMAASISHHALSNNYTVGLVSNDMQTRESKAFIVSPGRGEYQLTKILESLACINTLAYAPMAEHLVEVSRSFPIGSTITICISYVSDDLLNSIKYLLNKGCLVVVLYLGEGDLPNFGPDIYVYDFRKKMKK